MKTKQKYLGERGLILLIVLLSAFIPLSTDLYLPAMPTMSKTLSVSSGLVNMTLTMFFIVFGISALFWGPLSDKYGRKPILTLGLLFYMTGSVMCATTNSIYILILSRVIQAFGAGAVTAVASAIVKDSFEGRQRDKMFALIQSMSMLAPIIAPILGAFVLKFTDWHGSFWILAGIGFGAFIGSVLLQETVKTKFDGSIAESIGRLFIIAKNKNLASLVLIFSISAIPFMAFIAISSYIYIDGFKLSEQSYSFFFAANAMFSIMGPLIYIKISKKLTEHKIITIGFTVSIISGLLICLFGHSNPILFALSLIPGTLMMGLTRPLGASMIFRQIEGDAGAVSSIMGFSFTIFGFIGMFSAALNLMDNIYIIGIFNFVIAAVGLGLWLYFSNRINYCRE